MEKTRIEIKTTIKLPRGFIQVKCPSCTNISIITQRWMDERSIANGGFIYNSTHTNWCPVCRSNLSK